MALLKPFMLQKLKILAFTDADRKQPAPTPEFEVMYNPESVKQNYAIVWAKAAAVNESGATLNYSRSAPSELSLEFVLDGTGVDELGISQLGSTQSVSERVEQFLAVTFQYQGSIHEPYYLLISWGGIKNFKCRFSNVEINYTMFDRQGLPLRAQLKATLISDSSAVERAQKENKSSPDVTHAHIVRSGDTLPLLTKRIYGSAANYLDVARYNNLDNFRKLKPGQQLLFPPLASLTIGTGPEEASGMPALTPTILSGGTPMDPTYALISIDVRSEVDRIPYAELRIQDGSSAQRDFAISDTSFFAPGAEIEIKLRYEGQPDVSVFKGLAVRHGIEASSEGSILLVECKDAALKLTGARRSAVYQKKSDSEIIKQIVQDCGLSVGTVVDTKPTHPEMVQYHATPWDFILSRADAQGLLVVVSAGTLSLHKIEITGSAKHRFEYGMNRILDIKIEADGGLQPEAVESVAWDLKQQQLTAASKAASVQLSPGDLDGEKIAKALGTGTCTLTHPVPLDPDELQAWADGRLARSRMALLRGRLAVPGFGDIQLMDVLEVAGLGKRFNGKTLVTGIRHRVDTAGWRTDVQFGLSPDGFARRPHINDAPAAGLLPTVGGLQIGVVADFAADPDSELRVKVNVPGVATGSDGAVWARLGASAAGNGRGFYFRPETGDEVVVGFLNDDPRCPVILGALFGSKNAPPSAMGSPDKKNENAGVVTKKGTTIGFVDGDKASVFIETAQKNKLLLDDDAESISLTDQHGSSITMNKDGVVIKSAKAFKIDASGEVEIKGSKVDVK